MKKSGLLVSLLALPALAADIGSLKPVQVFPIAPLHDPHLADNLYIHVQQAVRVGDRYLAVVLSGSRMSQGKERLRKFYGSSIFLAPAWFSARWKMLHLGDPLFAGPAELVPITLRGWGPTLLDPLGLPRYGVYRFPEVLVRAAGGAGCPYLIVTTTQVACLGESLKLGARWETPFQVMDYFTWQETFWMAGYQDGYLLHQLELPDEGHGPYEIRPVRVARSVLALSALRTFLEARGYSSADLRDLDPSTWDLFVQLADKSRRELAEDPQKLESLMRKDSEGRRYLHFAAHRSLRPVHFPMAVTAQGDRAYVVLHRPFGVVVVHMPEGHVLDFWPIRREDLPVSVRNYTRPVVWSITPVRGRLFISVRLERDIPYQELRMTNPDEAAWLAREWSTLRRSRCSDIVPCDAPLTPETVVGTESARYGLEMTDRGAVHRVYSLDWSDGKWSYSVLSSVFFPAPDEMWMSVRTEETGTLVYGVVRLAW